MAEAEERQGQNHIQTVVFDFDGVIVAHSEFFKEEAWKKVFSSYAGTYEVFFEEARAQFGFGKPGDRFDILRYVYTRLLVSDIEERVREGARVFDAYVQEAILAVGVTEGVREALQIYKRSYALYVNTGTAQSAIDLTIHNLKLDPYFKKVLGGPSSKAENLRTICALESIAPEDMVLIGDSDGDVNAAEEIGCHFIGISNAWNTWEGQQKKFPVVSHIREAKKYLETRPDLFC